MEHVSNPIAKILANAIIRSGLSAQKCLREFDENGDLKKLVEYEVKALQAQELVAYQAEPDRYAAARLKVQVKEEAA